MCPSLASGASITLSQDTSVGSPLAGTPTLGRGPETARRGRPSQRAARARRAAAERQCANYDGFVACGCGAALLPTASSMKRASGPRASGHPFSARERFTTLHTIMHMELHLWSAESDKVTITAPNLGPLLTKPKRHVSLPKPNEFGYKPKT